MVEPFEYRRLNSLVSGVGYSDDDCTIKSEFVEKKKDFKCITIKCSTTSYGFGILGIFEIL